MDYKMLISLFALFLCVVGSSGCTYFNNDPLHESDVQLPEGWTFNKNETAMQNYQMSYNKTLVWDYNSELSVFISKYNNQSQYDKYYKDDIELTTDDAKYPNETFEIKNITIEGTNVKLVKDIVSYFDAGAVESYYFQKNDKYYSVEFYTNPYNGYTNMTENPYRAQIDEALKSIIKTI